MKLTQRQLIKSQKVQEKLLVKLLQLVMKPLISWIIAKIIFMANLNLPVIRKTIRKEVRKVLLLLDGNILTNKMNKQHFCGIPLEIRINKTSNKVLILVKVMKQKIKVIKLYGTNLNWTCITYIDPKRTRFKALSSSKRGKIMELEQILICPSANVFSACFCHSITNSWYNGCTCYFQYISGSKQY